jgi:arginase
MTSSTRVMVLPYDSGRLDARMGRGPAALVPALPPGCEVEEVTPGDIFPAEVAVAFALAGRLAVRVRAAVAAGRFPLVLSGNCLPAAVGTLAGLGPAVGVAWLDAHGDFHTPETTPSGFVDGMALAVAAGRCWRSLASVVPGFKPVPARRLVHVGGRAFDPGERERLSECGAQILTAPAAVVWPAGTRGVYVHLDLDVLDPRVVPANGYQPGGGLSAGEVIGFIRGLRAALPVLAASVTAYDPDGDPDGRAAVVVAAVAAALLS